MVLIRAYVLAKVAPNLGREITVAIRALQGVKSADLVTGPYDVIIIAEAENLNDIADLLVSKIHAICGVTSTATCLAVRGI